VNFGKPDGRRRCPNNDGARFFAVPKIVAFWKSSGKTLSAWQGKYGKPSLTRGISPRCNGVYRGVGSFRRR
jgi:hypothetical protein